MSKDKKIRKIAVAHGETPARAKMMARAGVSVDLQATWLAQLLGGSPAPAASPDVDRYRLHAEATTLAAKRRKANPRLDPGETYALAAIEIADRHSLSVI